MKKFLFFVVAIGCLAFIGCSKEDDESNESIKEQLIGTWGRTAVESSGNTTITIEQIQTFNINNTAYTSAKVYLNGSLMQSKSFEYTYTCKGDMLYMTGKDSGTTQAYRVSITGKTMSMTGDDGILTFTKQ